MNYNAPATRLTLYALISSMEMDMRAFILQNINETNENIIMDDILKERLTKRAKNNLELDNDIETIIEYLDFGDCISIINKFKSIFPDSFKNDIKNIADALSNITSIRNRVMHSRPLEFTDLTTVVDFIMEFSNSKLINFTKTIDIKQQINKDPAVVFTLKIPELSDDLSDNIYNNLPPVEFDDTGFIGRTKDIDIIKRKIYGNHNVISVIGDGGIGKTALVLKCMYDILDNSEQIFDAIIWVSLKTRNLSNGEFINIKNAISSTFGMYEEIKNVLIGNTFDNDKDIITSIVEYMKEFKVLLVLDNFETINSETVKDFFDNIPIGSKVVITSRIGVGEFETRTTLTGFNKKERISYMKRLAQTYKLNDILKLGDSEIDNICERLYSNPLAIKWVIASIIKGNPIEAILNHTNELTNYCMSNVYEKLSDDAKKLLETMLVFQKECGDAEIGYLVEMAPIMRRRSINELLTTNMVRMRTVSEDSIRKSMFSITEFAREYLIQYCKPSPISFKNINKKMSALKGLGQNLTVDVNIDPYNPKSLTFSNDSDELLAAYNLKQALTASAQGKDDDASNYIEKAKEISPNYFEVYKISGFLSAKKGETFTADEEYKTALQCKNNYAPLLFLYAGFRMRFLDDFSTALEYLNAAQDLDNNNINIKIEKARTHMLLNEYEIADSMFKNLLQLDNTFENKQKRITVNCAADNVRRWAEMLTKKENYEQAFELYEKVISYIDYLDESEKDSKVIITVCKTISNLFDLNRVISIENKNKITSKAIEIFSLYKHKIFYNDRYKTLKDKITNNYSGISTENRIILQEIIDSNYLDRANEISNDNEGIVTGVCKGFGFITNSNSNKIFFFWKDYLSDFSKLEVGQKVKFSHSTNDKGPCAVNVVNI